MSYYCYYDAPKLIVLVSFSHSATWWQSTPAFLASELQLQFKFLNYLSKGIWNYTLLRHIIIRNILLLIYSISKLISSKLISPKVSRCKAILKKHRKTTNIYSHLSLCRLCIYCMCVCGLTTDWSHGNHQSNQTC